MSAYTPGQLQKIMELLKGKTSEHLQKVLGSGLFSDILDPRANLANRIAVRQALDLGPLPSEPGSHIVDYGQNLDAMIIAGAYDWKNDDITAKRFPIAGEGKVEFEDTLFHFDRDISSADAIKAILAADPKNPWAVGQIENLLAYGAKNPEEQKKFPVVALGSVARVVGSRCVTFLGVDGSGRYLYLRWFVRDWYGSCRFLAVRKKSQASAS